MNGVLVDSSVWISYFKGVPTEKAVADGLDYLISGDEVLINEIILTELLPAMEVRGGKDAIDILSVISRITTDVDWTGIRKMQVACLNKGINKVGISDLIIAQQAIQSGIPLFSLDKHFRLIADLFPLKLWPEC